MLVNWRTIGINIKDWNVLGSKDNSHLQHLRMSHTEAILKRKGSRDHVDTMYSFMYVPMTF